MRQRRSRSEFSEPAALRPDRPRAAALRSALMLETAAELVAQPSWAHRQVFIQMRGQGDSSWAVGLFGSDSLGTINEIAAGRFQFGIVNPSVAAALAVNGSTPFGTPIPLRAIATMPSFDQLGLAVRSDLKVTTLGELLETRPPIRLSMRAQPDHSVLTFIEHVLAAGGVDLAGIRGWGGDVRYDEGLPHFAARRQLMADGLVDAVFDEGIFNWVDQAVRAEFTFLSLDRPILDRLVNMGHRAAVLTRERFPSLTADVVTLDFSGWLVYTHAEVSDQQVTAFCAALSARAWRIPWQGTGGLPIRRMVNDAIDAPITIPFHPAAERYWRDHGYLD